MRHAIQAIGNSRHRCPSVRRWGWLALALWSAPLLTAGCESPVSPPLDPSSVEWTSSADAGMGIRIDHPTSWAVHRQGPDLRFQDAARTPMRITLVSAEEARRRGLWATTEPLRTETRGANTGQLYRYKHYDGPIYVPTLAFVVAYRGEQLGIELRTDNLEPDQVQGRILDSLALDAP